MGGKQAEGDKKYRAEFVARQFVEIYYRILSSKPGDLYRFYKSESLSSFAEGPEEPAVVLKGEREIQETPRSDFEACRFEFLSIDSQWSAAESIALLVYGSVFQIGGERTFVHSFLLCPQANGWFVRNDMFRFVGGKRLRGAAAGSAPYDMKVEKVTNLAPEKLPEVPGDIAVGMDMNVGDVNAGTDSTLLVDGEEDIVGSGATETAKKVGNAIETEMPVEPAVVLSNAEPNQPYAMGELTVERTADQSAVQTLTSTPTATGKTGVSGSVPATTKLKEQSAASKKISYASIVAKVSEDGQNETNVVDRTDREGRITAAVDKYTEPAMTSTAPGEMNEVLNGTGDHVGVDQQSILPGVYLHQLPNPRMINSANLTEVLTSEFSKYGKVLNVDVRHFRGFAFVDFESTSAVNAAVAAWSDSAPDSAENIIKKIKVQVRKPPPKSSNRGTEKGSYSGKSGAGRNRPSGSRSRGEAVDAETAEDARKASRGGKREKPAVSYDTRNGSRGTAASKPVKGSRGTATEG